MPAHQWRGDTQPRQLCIATALAVKPLCSAQLPLHPARQSNLISCLRIRLFNHDQQRSILLISGEEGGKYFNWQPAASINWRIRPPLWKVALSAITICPGFSVGIKQVSTQVSNTVRLQELSTVNGANNSPSQYAAILLTRPCLMPLFKAEKRLPLGFQP